MRRGTRGATILLCSVALIGMSAAASARPLQKQAAVAAQSGVAGSEDPHTFMRADWKRMQGKDNQAKPRRARSTAARPKAARPAAVQPVFGGFGGGSLVAEARRHLGTNPTGRRSLWCGAFMDMVLKRTGHEGGGNLALGYSRYGKRIAGPQVGAIAVMRRGGGGHVGVVSGIDSNGNPIIVSGNHNNTVAETVYPRGRITAYVLPSG